LETRSWKEVQASKAILLSNSGIYHNRIRNRFVNIDPIKALIYTAVINGITAVPILSVILKIANDQKILDDKTNSLASNVLEWLTFLIMAISVVVLLFTWSGY
jgi:Mn2+/Fe2+ NRAMP family transporter